MRCATLVFGLGIGAMLAACAVILSADFGGDRNFTPELLLVVATVAMLGVASYCRLSECLQFA